MHSDSLPPVAPIAGNVVFVRQDDYFLGLRALAKSSGLSVKTLELTCLTRSILCHVTARAARSSSDGASSAGGWSGIEARWPQILKASSMN
jgi:hypothetical protein